jgi:hypothetical protein
MAIESIRCPVLAAPVTRVTDLEGMVTRIICAEYEPATGHCRLEEAAMDGGPLSRLIIRTSEGTLATRGMQCVLRAA